MWRWSADAIDDLPRWTTRLRCTAGWFAGSEHREGVIAPLHHCVSFSGYTHREAVPLKIPSLVSRRPTEKRPIMRKMSAKCLYDDDEQAWVDTQIEALRARRFDDLDIEDAYRAAFKRWRSATSVSWVLV